MSTQVLENTFVMEPEDAPQIETNHRRIKTKIPAPATIERLRDAMRVFPQVNCYQPPILWDRAIGYQVFDAAGNCWIDFTSTAVMTNTGHGHPAIRAALKKHAERELLAQFSFASDVRITLAEELVKLAPEHCDKVMFWTVGSETSEGALRLARMFGMRKDPEKYRILTFTGDYHGWTLGAHQVSGDSATKPWLTKADSAIHHLPFPKAIGDQAELDDTAWVKFFDDSVAELESRGVCLDTIAGIFVETFQGWCATPLPLAYVKRLREWADERDALLIFDEIQTGFGRTGRWFAHEHYDVKADLICIAKGVTSSLPLSAVLGPAEVLDILTPGEVTTTHAAHPLSCAAALANLQVLRDENLIEESARKGKLAKAALAELQSRFPKHIASVTGEGLMIAVHLTDPTTGVPSRELARDWVWAGVKHGIMLFQVNQATIKVVPPLVIPDDALLEGIDALGDALATVV